jgi:hypothetical protein
MNVDYPFNAKHLSSCWVIAEMKAVPLYDCGVPKG